MKSVNNKTPEEKIKYPCLMRSESSEAIILLYSSTSGMVISDPCDLYYLGYKINFQYPIKINESFSPWRLLNLEESVTLIQE